MSRTPACLRAQWMAKPEPLAVNTQVPLPCLRWMLGYQKFIMQYCTAGLLMLLPDLLLSARYCCEGEKRRERERRRRKRGFGRVFVQRGNHLFSSFKQ